MGGRIRMSRDGVKGVGTRMGKTVLVTGAGGFIGSHLAELWSATAPRSGRWSGTTAATTAGTSTGSPDDIRAAIEVHRGDLKDPEAVRKAVDGPGLGLPPRRPDRDPLFVPESARRGADQRARDRPRARRLPGQPSLERVVLTFTSEVYGTAQFVPIDEKHPLRGHPPTRRPRSAPMPSARATTGLRPARGDPPAVQHVRPAAVGAGDHPDDHQPGPDPPGREARAASTLAAI